MKKTFKTRNAELTGNGRSSFRFETTTWDLIDRMAAKRGIRWQQWARDVLATQPEAPNKAALLRAALADELMTEQLMVAGDAGPVETNVTHEIIGNGYWRLNDEQLKSELESAVITARDNTFTAFALITGYRRKESGGEPFVIVQNALRDGLHLMIAPTVE